MLLLGSRAPSIAKVWLRLSGMILGWLWGVLSCLVFPGGLHYSGLTCVSFTLLASVLIAIDRSLSFFCSPCKSACVVQTWCQKDTRRQHPPLPLSLLYLPLPFQLQVPR
ncbi:hypothetical protein B0H12DRAFT_743560 [Mycena haematopus]|nr:hypothetical protein B0H12DRAFT_743560 [Mycena haematopus]